MPTTFDLSDAGAPAPSPGGPSSSKPEPGFEIPDALAGVLRFVIWASIVCAGLIVIYLGWGLISGSWATPAYNGLGHMDRARQLENIADCQTALRIVSVIFLLSFLILNFQDSSIGYVLLGVSAVLYFGFPYIGSELLGFQNLGSSPATQAAEQDAQSVAILYFVPGILWALYDFVQRMRTASERSAIQRANVRYGSKIARQTHKKQRNVFLGRCWELAYCRDNVRVRCPIFLKKKGPCWWYKQGCMCDERIVLQAVIDSDWKDKKNAAVGTAPASGMGPDMGLQAGTVNQPFLSMAKKIERCKSCVIYNEHQRQKYHAMVVAAFIIVPTLLYYNSDLVEKGVDSGLNGFESLTQRLSFTSGQTSPLLTGNEYSSTLEWTLIAAAFVLIMSQLLRLIEYICFKLKI